LTRWEKVTFRIYGLLNRDARTRVGEYVRLAWNVINENISVPEIADAITQMGEEFPIELAIEALRNTNCYDGWQEELRYFMFRYEEHLSRTKGQNFENEQWERIWMVSPSDSIEHIWAKSVAPEKTKHRLGNLVLLPPRLNSTLQDIASNKKATPYRETGLLIANEVANLIDAARGKWNKGAIENRENELIEWATKEWAD
jgi:hypothetical protein